MINPRIMRSNRKKKGMTLIEIMVVLIIIGIISGIVAVNVMGLIGDANKKRVFADFHAIKEAANFYKLEHHKLPNSISDLTSGENPRLEKTPTDPWGKEYTMTKEGKKVVVRCYGADGAPGGEGEDQDYDSETIDDNPEN